MDKSSERSLGERLAQARRLKSVRDWRDITHVEVAAEAMTTPQTVSRWEAGKATPQKAALHLAARFLEADEGWIATGEGEPPKAHPAPEMPAVQDDPKPKDNRHPLQKEVGRTTIIEPIIHDRKQQKGKGRKRG